MSDGWKRGPDDNWEIRSRLRYGSKFDRYADTKDRAITYVQKQIKKHGNVGSFNVVGRVVYYDIYPEIE